MKIGERIGLGMLLFGVGIFTVGCGDEQEEAIVDLGTYGYTFSVGDYLRAAGDGNVAAVELFHASGMTVDTPDAEGSTALMMAVSQGRWELVRMLVGKGADIQHAGRRGETVLMAATRGGDFETVKYLLERGADPAVKDNEGWSPLTAAAYKGDAPLVGLLAPKTRRYLDDALYLAAVDGSPEVTDILLNYGASVYARSNDNWTALMYAAENGHLEIAKLLMKNGANRFAMDDDDRTAADLARAAGAVDLVDYLEEPQLELETESVVAGRMVDVEEELGGYDVIEATGAEAGAGLGVVGGTGQDSASVAGGLLRASMERGTAPQKPVRVVARIEGARIAAAVSGSPGPDAAEGGDSLGAVVKMHDYREAQLPLMLEGVDETGKVAEVKMLTGGAEEPLKVKSGEEIAGTGLRVVELKRVMTHSKQGKGQLMDMSRMMVEEVASGERHLVVTGVPARSSRTYALMSMGDGKLYDVRAGDEFAVGGAVEGRYRVIDVRPTQVVIENVETGEPMTVERF